MAASALAGRSPASFFNKASSNARARSRQDWQSRPEQNEDVALADPAQRVEHRLADQRIVARRRLIQNHAHRKQIGLLRRLRAGRLLRRHIGRRPHNRFVMRQLRLIPQRGQTEIRDLVRTARGPKYFPASDRGAECPRCAARRGRTAIPSPTCANSSPAKRLPSAICLASVLPSTHSSSMYIPSCGSSPYS